MLEMCLAEAAKSASRQVFTATRQLSNGEAPYGIKSDTVSSRKPALPVPVDVLNETFTVCEPGGTSAACPGTRRG